MPGPALRRGSRLGRGGIRPGRAGLPGEELTRLTRRLQDHHRRHPSAPETVGPALVGEGSVPGHAEMRAAMAVRPGHIRGSAHFMARRPSPVKPPPVGGVLVVGGASPPRERFSCRWHSLSSLCVAQGCFTAETAENAEEPQRGSVLGFFGCGVPLVAVAPVVGGASPPRVSLRRAGPAPLTEDRTLCHRRLR